MPLRGAEMGRCPAAYPHPVAVHLSSHHSCHSRVPWDTSSPSGGIPPIFKKRVDVTMSSHAQQARTLVEALPYIQKFTGKTIVVKYGGNAWCPTNSAGLSCATSSCCPWLAFGWWWSTAAGRRSLTC